MNKRQALIVEDRSITAIDLAAILTKNGYSSFSVKSGEEALEVYNNKKPDLVVMDIMLKGYYTGLDTAEIIRSQSNVPIIFITALNDDETMIKAHSLRPLAILSKPYDERFISRLVKSLNEELTLNA